MAILIYIVYVHTNKVNGKKYVGMTNDSERRWRNKGIEYKPSNKKNQNVPFWNAVKKYGLKGFDTEVLFEGLSFDDCCKKEIETIKKLETTNKEKGYNISKGGNGGIVYEKHPRGMLGKSQTKNQKEGHREWASKEENNCMTNGQVVWGETHEHPKGMLGKNHSEESKDKIGKFMRKSHPNFKKCYAVYPDGTKKEYKSPKFLCEDLGISGVSSSIYISMKKKPYAISKQSRVKRHDLVGISIEF